jgi:hypothetical protein
MPSLSETEIRARRIGCDCDMREFLKVEAT